MTDIDDPASDPTGDTTGGTVDEPVDPAKAAKARRNRRIQAIVMIVLLVLLFGFIIPSVVDYGKVWKAITSLSWWQFGVLLLIGFVRIGIVAGQHAAAIPTLSYGNAIRAYLASGTLAEIAPPPADLAVRFGMYRAQGIDAERAGIGITLTGLFDNAVKILLPIVALGLLVAAGVDDATTRELFVLGALTAVGLTVLLVALVRSDRFTMWFGRTVGRIISWFLVKFNRNPLEDLGDKSTAIRGRLVGTLRARWVAILAATLFGQVASYVILLAALRFVGVSSDQVDWVSLLAAFALASFVGSLPLTPGGVGVSALAYTWLLAPNNPELANLIASASLLNKVFTWLLPIVSGIVPLTLWRRANRSTDTLPDTEPAIG